MKHCYEMLTFALICLYLPFAAFAGGEAARAALSDLPAGSPEAIPYYIPFAISCVLTAFSIFIFRDHPRVNRALSNEERDKWKRDLTWLLPVSAPRYWWLYGRK